MPKKGPPTSWPAHWLSKENVGQDFHKIAAHLLRSGWDPFRTHATWFTDESDVIWTLFWEAEN